jgi:HEAT repeat protein
VTIEVMGDYVVEQTRRYLQDPEPLVRRAAVSTLGALHDMNVMEDFLELLEDPDAGVRRATHEALKRFSGRNMPADAAMWEHWWDSQLDWFLDDSEALVSAGPHPAADWAIARLKDTMSYPAFRQHTAFDVASMLAHNDESVAVFAALCLERLGEARVTSYLIESLQDSRPVVREAVARALRTLTGEDHLAQYDAWSHWLDG